MDLARWVLRLGTLAAVALLVAVGWVTTQHAGEPLAVTPIRDAAGNPLPVPSSPGIVRGVWEGTPVMVFTVSTKELDAVDAARGHGSATPSIAAPGNPELRIFALSAKSTHLGCTVGWNAALGASHDIADYDGDGINDGRILDPCHQGQWDAYHRGMPVAGPAPVRLAVLDLSITDGHLGGDFFDGPVGPQRHL